MIKFSESEIHLLHAEKFIPLGSQTFSKSKVVYPVGISPLYLDRSVGPYSFDIDGNKYVDLVSSLASVTLGYGDREVTRAVKKQLAKGTTLSLPGKLEAEVAELMVDLVPCAESVRFGKNGSDSASAAVRLARAYTGRNLVLTCGYHGWHDWYISGTSRNKGIPEAVKLNTLSFKFNDLESFKNIFYANREKVAAVILEPMNSTYPQSDFLEELRRITEENGSLLIFDETITGFRFSKGGAQELFGVTPDLATFGKGMANGFPLSAVVGKREIMKEMENIFCSSTFGGELLSLAASRVVLYKVINEEVCDKLEEIGELIANDLVNQITDLGLSETLRISGHPSWKFLNWTSSNGFSENEIKTFFLQEAFQNGLLVQGTHNVTLKHSAKIRKSISRSYSRILSNVSEAIQDGTLRKTLRVAPQEPIFKIR